MGKLRQLGHGQGNCRRRRQVALGMLWRRIAQGNPGLRESRRGEKERGNLPEGTVDLSELPARFAREGNGSTEPCAPPRGARARLLPNWESAPTSVDEYAHRQPIEA